MTEDMEAWIDFIPIEHEPVTSVYDTYWTTGKGKTIKFSDMDDSHLRNSIKLCMRKGWPVPVLMLAELLNRKGLLE